MDSDTQRKTCSIRRIRRALCITGALAFIAVLVFVHEFLAVSSPSGQGVLIVEAWVPKQSLADSAAIFRDGRYEYLVLVGGPVKQKKPTQTLTLTYADSAADEIRGFNVDPAKIVTIPVGSAKNRTYSTAVAVRDWLRSSGSSTHSIDVFTAGVHARKSWVLFRYALGDSYRVGVIAGPEHSYDPRFWPASRRGAWIVSRNVAGYLYYKAAILLDTHGWKVLTNDSRVGEK
jgi:hypothetical protein